MKMRRIIEVGDRGILEFVRTFRIGIYRNSIWSFGNFDNLKNCTGIENSMNSWKSLRK